MPAEERAAEWALPSLRHTGGLGGVQITVQRPDRNSSKYLVPSYAENPLPRPGSRCWGLADCIDLRRRVPKA